MVIDPYPPGAPSRGQARVCPHCMLKRPGSGLQHRHAAQAARTQPPPPAYIGDPAAWRGSWCGRFENFKLLYFFAKYTHHYFYNENPVWTDGRAHPRGFRFHHNYRGTGIPIGLAVIAEVVTKTTTSNPALVRNRR